MQKLLTTAQAAPLMGVEAKTAENWRCQGFGPKFIRVGRLIKYDPDDIAAWRAERRVGSTSQLIAA